MVGELFDLDRLDDTDPFEIDRQATHLFKHDLVVEIASEVLVAPLAPSDHDDRPSRPKFIHVELVSASSELSVARDEARLIGACCEPAFWVANRKVHDESDDVFAVTDGPIHCKFDQMPNRDARGCWHVTRR